MPIRVEEPRPTLAAALAAAHRPLTGMWVCSGSALVAEICAGSGVDWLLVDVEHGPNTLTSTLAQLQAVAAYDVVPVVRVPWNDPVQIKQYLDAGVQNLLVPMVDTAEAAAAAVAAIHYPGTAGTGTAGTSTAGIRGVGAALGRSSRWGRIPDYLARASETVSLTVQIETGTAVENVEEILAVDGVDAIFLGPSDLAASLGLLGQQEHPDVLAAVTTCVRAGAEAGKPVGINAFNPERARAYAEGGAAFVSVGSDVTLLARGSEDLAGVLGTSVDCPAVPRRRSGDRRSGGRRHDAAARNGSNSSRTGPAGTRVVPCVRPGSATARACGISSAARRASARRRASRVPAISRAGSVRVRSTASGRPGSSSVPAKQAARASASLARNACRVLGSSDPAAASKPSTNVSIRPVRSASR